MSTDAGVAVQRAIVHIVNHKNKKLVLSGDELALEGNDELRDYLSKQVANARDDSQTQSARFAKKDSTATKDDCVQILNESKRFIATSQSLATRLYEAMFLKDKNVPDERIAVGSLVVCVYTDANVAGDALALIKLDPSEAFLQKVTQTGVVTLDRRENVMPTPNQQLQKAALVLPAGSDKKRDLLLLDRQTRATAATFFARDFLNAVPVYSAEEQTDALHDGVRAGLEKLLKQPEPLPPKDAEAVVQQLHAKLTAGNDVVVEDFLEDLPEAARPVIRSEMRKRIPDKKLKVVRDYAEQNLLKKKRFRGGYGVLFEVDDKDYDKVVISRQDNVVLDDGKTGSILTIQVPNFHSVI